MDEPTKAFAAAVEAALAAGAVLEAYFEGETLDVRYKGEVNLVTEADTEAERVVVDTLRRRLPGVAVLAEEGGETGGESRGRFLVDPLDGTTNFAHGYPFYAVSIAYEREEETLAAVVYDPHRNELFTAEKGKGALLNGRPLRVSRTDELARALLVTGFPYDLKDDLAHSLRLFYRFMGEVRAIRRDGSAALDLCYVAAGRVDGFWEEKLAPWDTAAGALVVSEAGGRVTDFAGGPFDCRGSEVLATNGRLHEAMLAVLADVGAADTGP